MQYGVIRHISDPRCRKNELSFNVIFDFSALMQRNNSPTLTFSTHGSSLYEAILTTA